jgi:membrane protease YdiL (CAAX protease family)
VVGWLEQRTVSEIALRDLVPQTARGVALGSGLFSLAILLIFACGGYRAEWGSAEDMVATLGLMTAIATCEALLFRGVLFRLMEERAGTVVAAVSSSAIFGGVHLINPQATVWGAVALAIEMGLLTAGCFALTRSLWLPIGFHLGWNFAQSGIFGTTVSGSDSTVGGLLKGTTSGRTLISGGEFGPEASVFAVVLGGVAGCVMLIAAWKRGRFVRPPKH